MSRAAAADLLGLPERTLTDWDHRNQADDLVPRPLGRPSSRAPVSSRNLVLSLLDLFGPDVGMPTLQALAETLLPETERLSRRELEELLARYRELYWQLKPTLVHALSWSRAGIVWAMDFTEPPSPVDGTANAILVVRDLASGYTLEALPVRSADGATVCAVLQRLFLRHGPPLVLKSDNGSHFTAGRVQDLLGRYGVTWLPSPPRRPGYNGSIEASMTSLKRRAGAFAQEAGRETWCRQDLDLARLQGNATPRRRRLAGDSPSQVWEARQPISAGLRVAFLATCRRGARRAALQLGELDLASLGVNAWRATQRAVVSRALVEYGFLSFRRRWIAPPVRPLKLADNP